MALTAADGAIGEVSDLHFDDESWGVRYLVVNTGTWLNGRSVLVSPVAVRNVDATTKQIFVNLTQKQVENSPDIDTRQPVSRQHESTLLSYYGYPVYWGGPFLWGAVSTPEALGVPNFGGMRAESASSTAARTSPAKPDADAAVRLRSTKEVSGYHIQAADGEIGHVEDFVIDDQAWAVRYVVVDTRNWLPGKKVLVAPQWVDRVSWDEHKVFINLTRAAISKSPEYDPAALISRDYESALYQHYGRQGYWT
jgi:uncharacterized protein YrrD